MDFTRTQEYCIFYNERFDPDNFKNACLHPDNKSADTVRGCHICEKKSCPFVPKKHKQ